MDYVDLTLLIALMIAGLYMAWNIGANDVANAMGTSVGSGALTLRQAVILAAIFEFLGAYFFGSYVSETIQSDILSPEIFGPQPRLYVIGMLSSLFAAGIWLQVASYFGWPVSTTHSIIGAIVGFGLVAGGFDAVEWNWVLSIVASWVISPLLGGVLALYLFSLIRDRVLYSPRPLESTKKLTPYFVFVLTFLLFLTLFMTGNDHLGFDIPIPSLIAMVLLLSISGAFISHHFVQKVDPEVEHPTVPSSYQPEIIIGLGKVKKHLMRVEAHTDGEVRNKVHSLMKEVSDISQSITQGPFQEVIHTHLKWVEIIFSKLQIFSACIMAFAHGSNDVANAIGPMTGSIRILLHGHSNLQADVPNWALALGGLGIVVGLATWGWRVIMTIGKKITELTPTRGFSAELSAALVVLVASKLGLPISATHTLVGAVLGVGLARGLGAINLSITRDILASWVVTVPAGAILSVLFYSVLNVAISAI